MEEPAQLVCWRMELIEISHKELELLGEAEVLVKLNNNGGFEHFKINAENQEWWNSNDEKWEKFENGDFLNFIENVKEIYLIVEE